MMQQRLFKGDKYNKMIGTRIPLGTVVNVVRFFPRRRVIVEYLGEQILTMLWCLQKIK